MTREMVGLFFFSSKDPKTFAFILKIVLLSIHRYLKKQKYR